MKSGFALFNGFLAVVLLATAGCATSEERKRRKEVSSLRIHVEGDRGTSDRSSSM